MHNVVAADGTLADAGIGLCADGMPSAPVRRFDLDDWHDVAGEDVALAARQAADSLALTIGVATRPLPASLDPLLDALTVTVALPAEESLDQRIVTTNDPELEFARIDAAARRCPQACVAANQLLRQTPSLNTLAGLAAEAAVYSMLLSGGEFAGWLAARGESKPAGKQRTPPVHVSREGAHLSVVLDRPERRNAISVALREALTDAFEIAAADDTIANVDVSGTGPVFCSGGDLAEFGTATDLVAAYLVRLDRAPWRLIDRLADRVTMRIHGAAVGAGVEMAAFASHVIATPETFLLLPEIEMGLVPGAGGTVSITRRIGRWRTAWLVLSGQRIDAATALRWQLVDALAEP